jgi:hypothetical protein
MGKLLLCSSYLLLGVPNWSVIYINTGAITFLVAPVQNWIKMDLGQK